MDYMFYTPPNTEPNIDSSVPFDQELALLEGRHYQATEQIRTIDAEWERVLTITSPDDSVDVNKAKESIAQQRQEVQAVVDGLEGEILRIRSEREASWQEHRRSMAESQAQLEGTILS